MLVWKISKIRDKAGYFSGEIYEVLGTGELELVEAWNKFKNMVDAEQWALARIPEIQEEMKTWNRR